MESIQTTGGLYTAEIREEITANICQVFSCRPDAIDELVPLQEGLSNIVLSFRYNGGKYIYRHPGLGSDLLVDRGRETIMQAVMAEAGIDTTLVAMDAENGLQQLHMGRKHVRRQDGMAASHLFGEFH